MLSALRATPLSVATMLAMTTPRYSWTQPCCCDCWHRDYPGRTPYRLRDPDLDVCCLCGAETRSGIYIRINPDTAPHPTLTKEDA